jgi:hypothetical protein
LVICVPVIFLVVSKIGRKSKYTISKTIRWTRSWICIAILDLDIHLFETKSKNRD